MVSWWQWLSANFDRTLQLAVNIYIFVVIFEFLLGKFNYL